MASKGFIDSEGTFHYYTQTSLDDIRTKANGDEFLRVKGISVERLSTAELEDQKLFESIMRMSTN